MSLVISTKGGIFRENNNTLVQNFILFLGRILFLLRYTKVQKGMLLQYSGVALVRDADIEIAK